MKSGDLDKIEKEFSALAQKFLSEGVSYQFVSDALGYTLLHLGPVRA